MGTFVVSDIFVVEHFDHFDSMRKGLIECVGFAEAQDE